jgi:hypothetical protein
MVANWSHIGQMCLDRFPQWSDEEFNIMATEMARQFTEEEAAAFEPEGEVGRKVLAQGVEVAAQQVDQALAAAEKEVVALCEIHHKVAIERLETVARDAATISMCAVHDSTTRREATTREKADCAAENAGKDCVLDAAAVAMAWNLLGKQEEEDEDK